MYTEEDYAAFNPTNFDFTHFDRVKAKADYKAYVAWKRKGDYMAKHPLSAGMFYCASARALHVTRCLSYGTRLERMEVPNTREPLRASDIQYTIDKYTATNA